MRVYSLHDVKSRTYGALMIIDTEEAAMRAVAHASSGAQSGMLHSHPQDFNLMFVGLFDIDTGKLIGSDVPILVANVASLLPTPTPGKVD